jgi:hypothetical protein
VTVIGAGNEEAATVVDADVLVGKGVVHVMDRALAVDPDASIPDDYDSDTDGPGGTGRDGGGTGNGSCVGAASCFKVPVH